MNNAKRVEINAGSKMIRSLVFLEDGKHLLSASEKEIRLWDIDDGTEIPGVFQSSGAVSELASSSDGNWIVSGGSNVATVWSAHTYQKHLTVNAHDAWVNTVDVSPDSTKFATGARDYQVFVWDILNGKKLVGPLVHNDEVLFLRFSPDGDRIASHPWGGLRIYNAHNGELLNVIQTQSVPVPSTPFAWTSDSLHIFSLFDQKIEHIDISAPGGSVLSEWLVPGDEMMGSLSIALSSNNKFIASFLHWTVSLWDTTTHKEIVHSFRYTGVAFLRSIALSLDCNYLAIGDEEGKIVLYKISDVIEGKYLGESVVPRIRNTKVIHDLEKEKDDLRREIESLRAKNQSQLDDLRKEKGVLEQENWSLRDQHQSDLDRVHAEKRELEEQIESLRLHRSEQTLRLEERLQDEKTKHRSNSDRLEKEQADLKNQIEWLQVKLDEGQLQLDHIQKEKGDLKQQVESLRSELSAQKLRSDELRNEITRPGDRLQVLHIRVGRGWVRSLVFLEDGNHLLSGSEEGIREWRIDDGTEIGQGLKGSSAVEAIAVSSDGKWIVSGEHKVVRVWNRNTRRSALTVKGHSTWVTTVDVSPDSTRFATGSSDKRVFIWDISTGARLVGPLEHDNYVVSVRFSPDGHRIATATWQRESLRIYNGLDGQLLHDVPVSVNSFPSTGIAWTNDSRRIFAFSSNIIKHIDANTGAFFPGWTVPGETVGLYGSIALSTNDRFIACFTGRSVSLWDTATRTQIGRPFEQASVLRSIALSLNHDYLATGDENGQIALRNLNNHLPKSYLTDKNAADVEQ